MDVARPKCQYEDYLVLILTRGSPVPVSTVSGMVAELFRKKPVLEMRAIERAAGARSRRSLFRDLDALGYLSSYTHTGRFYTLKSIPDFDSDGLWRYEGIGFSRDGTLKATVRRLVESAEAGHTQRELQLRLGTRVHNPLLALVEHRRLRREAVAAEYVYLAAARARAAKQLERRRAAAASAGQTPIPSLEVEVLAEVIHGARLPPPDAATLAARLSARGVRASPAEVGAVLERHGLKKTAWSPSRRSRH